MILLDRLLRPALPWAILVSGVNRRDAASTSGGKEMARGTIREDTLAVLIEDRAKREEKSSDRNEKEIVVREWQSGKRGRRGRENERASWLNTERLSDFDREAILKTIGGGVGHGSRSPYYRDRG